MSELMRINDAYKDWIKDVGNRFKQSQIKAAVKVNEEMLQFYFLLGKEIYFLKSEMDIGNVFYDNASKDLKEILPDVKSFSPTNLKYMQYYFELYGSPQLVDLQKSENLSPQVEDLDADIFKIPWGHHRCIIDKCRKNKEKAIFFVKKTIENNWSRSVLLNFLDTNLYERQGKAITNFSKTLPAVQSDLAQEITKDPYNFDFLTLTERYDEKELKDALMDNIQKFLLELGNGFAFVGREVRIRIGEKEKFIDMLFYNIKLHCYVVLEVKVTDFDSANMGQLGTYIVAVNHQLKGENDNPTIGLVVCKYKDNVEAQYALEATNQPIGVSEYELSKLIPEDFKGSLPTIEEIEEELREVTVQ